MAAGAVPLSLLEDFPMVASHPDALTPQAQWEELIRLLATGIRRLFDRLARLENMETISKKGLELIADSRSDRRR